MTGMCVLICQAKLVNDFNMELKQRTNIIQFKKKYRNNIFLRYKKEEGQMCSFGLQTQ